MKKRKTNRNAVIRENATRTTAKGREIVASLKEVLEAEKAGIPIESRFIVRTLD